VKRSPGPLHGDASKRHLPMQAWVQFQDASRFAVKCSCVPTGTRYRPRLPATLATDVSVRIVLQGFEAFAIGGRHFIIAANFWDGR
jgi:hypothetical protein